VKKKIVSTKSAEPKWRIIDGHSAGHGGLLKPDIYQSDGRIAPSRRPDTAGGLVEEIAFPLR
jgi:hypothetical protein